MKTSYYSLLLISCGAVYAFLSPGGPLGSGQGGTAASGPANAASIAAGPHAEKDATMQDGSTYPQELWRQIAEAEPGSTRDKGDPRLPKAPESFRLRDDIASPRFIIATVPDPASTHLRVEFDRAIDGIKGAAAAENFHFRRYWLPWPVEPFPQFSDRPSQEAEKEERALKRHSPGLLLFENASYESLIVLLVGESPTDGIHRQQFKSAIQLKREIERLDAIRLKKRIEEFEAIRLKQIGGKVQSASKARFYIMGALISLDELDRALTKRIEDPGHAPQAGRLYILGTTFSGSLHTLHLALAESQAGDFEAISGTAADKGSINSFNCQSGTSGEPHLRTIRHDSNTALRAFRRYACQAWRYCDPIAVLSETDTVFGALEGLGGGFLRIPFPRDIAHLRNAYQSYPGLSAFGQSGPDMQQQRNLPLQLDDSRDTINSIPDFAAQTVVSQETLVSQIANRIRHEHIRFACIIGSDVLDVLFITRFLRAQNPDTRLFLIEPDLLFVHAADALPFEGVLAVTTYPLLEGNPPFEPGKNADYQPGMFATPFEQGIHNAARVLLADMMHKPVPALPGYDILHQEDTQPALWITSVGRESFVPVAVIGNPAEPEPDPAETCPSSVAPAGPETAPKPDAAPPSEPALVAVPTGNREAPLSSSEPHEPTRIWRILLLAVTAGMVAMALIFRCAQKSSATWLNDFRMQGGEGNREHLTLFLVFAAGIYLAVGSTGIRTLVHRPLSDPVWLLLALVGLIALAGLAWQWVRRIHLKTPGVLAIVAAAVSVAAIIVLLVLLSYRPDNLTGALFSFRAFEVSAGAAPTIPFLFLFSGFLVWSFVNLQRNIFHHQRAPRLPRAKCDPILGKNVLHGAERLRQQMEKPFGRSCRVSTLVAAAAFAFCYYGLYKSPIRSFEGPWYDTLFTCWASALAAAEMVAIWHFWQSWSLLSHVLDQLETHPIRRAFSALPADHSWSPIWQSSPRKRSYLLATRSINALAALRGTDLCSQQLAPLIDSAEERVGVILGSVARGKREKPEQYDAAQKALAEVADNLLEALEPVWRRGSSEIIDQAKDASRKHEDELPPLIYAFEFVAMRYLAFIRYAMLQLRNMLTFLTLGFLAFAFALMSYPFEGSRLIAWVITAIFVVLSAVILFVFAQMETDATLSRITSGDAGKFGFEFFRRALAFGVLPLLTVLASNFNGVGRFVFSWIEPALKTLH
jgi:hypothetical protein